MASPTPAGSRAAVVERYRAHNDMIAEKQTPHVQICTITDLEIITRNTHSVLTRALRRITRLEQRLGIAGEVLQP